MAHSDEWITKTYLVGAPASCRAWGLRFVLWLLGLSLLGLILVLSILYLAPAG